MKPVQSGWIGAGLLLLLACESQPAAEGGSATASVKPTAAATASATATAAKSAAEPPAKPVASNVPDKVEGANMSMGSTTVDGLSAKQLSCKAGGMFASMAILGALAKKKATLDGCVGKEASVRVHFAFADGKSSDIRIADAPDAKAARCLADALAAIELPDKGACVLTLELGKK